MHHRGLRLGALEIHRNGSLPNQPPRANTARRPLPPGVHRHLQRRRPARRRRRREQQRRLPREPLQIRLGQMERGGQRPRRRLLPTIGNHQRRRGDLPRHPPEPDLAVARRGRRVDPRPRTRRRRRHRHSQRQVANQHPHERARVHGDAMRPQNHKSSKKISRKFCP
ncbi:Os03g0773050 [Oryza sativa Japonica Group]|uniref:Os03g0773050 protein n=1 Tax=Oryza sativa subsp. japonica TaxID=39947 RepID=A0A0P0W3H5_ORYSJ|nr:hypothetical protein EE612_020723 [Oryza sativa]BAS86608.1 Os03g0773050 [Oryza sativa Japonica Group]